jgi:hypothetical protein
MKIVVTFRGGPEWNATELSIPAHHLAHGVSEQFMNETLDWMYNIPGLDSLSTKKPVEANTGINWTTTIGFQDAPNVNINGQVATEAVICQYITDKYNSTFIPEMAKIGYDVTLTVE